MSKNLESRAQRKTSKFGFWKDSIVTLHRNEITISKNGKSRKAIKKIELATSTSVTLISNSVIKLKSSSTTYLRLPQSEIHAWFSAIKDECTFKKPKSIMTIGKGCFSKVTLSYFNNSTFALKHVSKKLSENISPYVERDAMLQCKHPFVLPLHSCYQTSDTFFYVMDFARGGNLFNLLQRNPNVSLRDKKIYLAEIGIALEFIHSKGFVYRDVKPENCLIGKDGHILLTDFGLSKKIEETTKTFCGSMSFIAPEMIQGNSYGFSVDWWSYGVLAYEVLTGKRPYKDDNEAKLLWKIVNTSPRFPAELDSDSQDFLIQFLKKDLTQRFTFNKSRKMKFWKGIDFATVERKEVALEFVPNEELSDEECCRMFSREKTKDDKVNKWESSLIYPSADRFSFVCEEFQSRYNST